MDYPGAIFTQATGENNHGKVVGVYQDSSGATHGFVYDSKTAQYTSVDAPGGTGFTFVNGTNDHDQIVGFVMPTSTTATGFVANPK